MCRVGGLVCKVRRVCDGLIEIVGVACLPGKQMGCTGI